MIVAFSDTQGALTDEDGAAADGGGDTVDAPDGHAQLDEGGATHFKALLDTEEMLARSQILEATDHGSERRDGRSGGGVLGDTVSGREHSSVVMRAAIDRLARIGIGRIA